MRFFAQKIPQKSMHLHASALATPASQVLADFLQRFATRLAALA